MMVVEKVKKVAKIAYDELGLERFTKPPEERVLDEAPPDVAPESLTNLKPAGQSVRVGQILEAKAAERKKKARADMLKRLAGEAPESIDTRPHVCEGLFGLLDLLAPDKAHAIYPQIISLELLKPTHPNLDKQQALMVVQRGINSYRVILGFKKLCNPIIGDLKSAQLSEIFTNEEKVAIQQNRPLKLDDWSAYINPEEVTNDDGKNGSG